MARIRTIKPAFWTDEKIVECSIEARLLFIGLWNFADDEGRMVLSPKRIKMEVFPGDDFTSTDIQRMLDELARHRLVIIYTVENVDYMSIRGWRHQKIDRPNRSVFPAPDDALSTTQPTLFDDQSTTNHPRKGREGKVEEERKIPSVSKESDVVSTNEDETAPEDRPKRKSRLPDDCPTVEDQTKALDYWAKHSIPANLPDEVERFRAHHAAKGELWLDWSAVWRTWYLNRKKFHQGPVGGAPRGKPCPVGGEPEPKAPVLSHDPDDRWRNAITAYRAGKPWQRINGSEPPDHEFTDVPERILREFGYVSTDTKAPA